MFKLRDDIPIKYLLNLHMIDSMIQKESIIFEIVKYIVPETEKRNSDIFRFTTNTLKYVFGENIKNSEFKQNVIAAIKYYIHKEYIKVEGSTFIFKNNFILKFYIND